MRPTKRKGNLPAILEKQGAHHEAFLAPERGGRKGKQAIKDALLPQTPIKKNPCFLPGRRRVRN